MKKVLVLSLAALCLSATARMAAAQEDASNNTITCNTITKGSISLKPALIVGGTVVGGVVKIKGSLSGCTTDNANITSITGSFKGELASTTTNDCVNLLGPTTNTGTIVIKWKSTPALVSSTSTVTITAGDAVGGLFAGLPPGTYGQFDLGNPPGTALAVTGSFTGGDGGATSVATVITTQDTGALAVACAPPSKGLKTLNIGLGTITLQ
jgi:hypothetical protein